MRELEVFNIKVNPLYRAEFLSIVESNLKNGHKIVQNGVNAATINGIVKNEKFRNALNNSDLINIDGMSVVWALSFLGYDIPERVACPDLAIDILRMAERQNYTVFFLGAQETCLCLCQKRLLNIFPRLIIAGSRNGYYHEEEEEEIIEMINRANPDIIFLGMPSPKKELFAEKYRHILTAKYLFGVGGLFEILSGLKKRAPQWMQNIGMEWFYRFLQEPGRMWRRYLVGNSHFIWLVFKERIKLLKTS